MGRTVLTFKLMPTFFLLGVLFHFIFHSFSVKVFTSGNVPTSSSQQPEFSQLQGILCKIDPFTF